MQLGNPAVRRDPAARHSAHATPGAQEPGEVQQRSTEYGHVVQVDGVGQQIYRKDRVFNAFEAGEHSDVPPSAQLDVPVA